MRIAALVLLCVLLTSCKVQKATSKHNASSKSEAKLIRDCFSGYKSAILNDQGEAAVDFVDSRTVNYYQDILDKTKTANKAEVNNLNITDKLMVLSIRHRTLKEDILKFDGKGLLVYAIQEGMVGKNSVSRNEIGEVKIDHNFAQGQIVVDGNPSPLYFHFYKESDKWKLNLTSLFPLSVQLMEDMVKESGKEENEYLFWLLELITGSKPTDAVWDKME